MSLLPERLELVGAAAVAAAVLALLARGPLSRVTARLWVGSVALVALLAPLAVTQGVSVLPRALRAVSVLLGVLALTASLSPATLGAALSGLKFPRGIVAVVTAILRQLGTLRVEGERVLLARRLRGAGGLTLGPATLATLFERSLERARQQELAARLRGYDSLQVEPAPLRLTDLLHLVPLTGVCLGLHALA